MKKKKVASRAGGICPATLSGARLIDTGSSQDGMLVLEANLDIKYLTLALITDFLDPQTSRLPRLWQSHEEWDLRQERHGRLRHLYMHASANQKKFIMHARPDTVYSLPWPPKNKAKKPSLSVSGYLHMSPERCTPVHTLPAACLAHCQWFFHLLYWPPSQEFASLIGEEQANTYYKGPADELAAVLPQTSLHVPLDPRASSQRGLWLVLHPMSARMQAQLASWQLGFLRFFYFTADLGFWGCCKQDPIERWAMFLLPKRVLPKPTKTTPKRWGISRTAQLP